MESWRLLVISYWNFNFSFDYNKYNENFKKHGYNFGTFFYTKIHTFNSMFLTTGYNFTQGYRPIIPNQMTIMIKLLSKKIIIHII